MRVVMSRMIRAERDRRHTGDIHTIARLDKHVGLCGRAALQHALDLFNVSLRHGVPRARDDQILHPRRRQTEACCGH